MKNTRPLRVDEELMEIIHSIKIDRIKLGNDLIPKSDRRITKAIARLIKKDFSIYDSLIKSPLDDDRSIRRRI